MPPARRTRPYFDGARFIFLLGPATVALAIPLYVHFRRVKAMLLPIAVGLVAGSLTAAFSALLVAKALGASITNAQLSLAPKSVTTPIAMGIAERLGGLPSLTAVLVITTGILGAVAGRYLFDALGVRSGDPRLRHRRHRARHRHRAGLPGERAGGAFSALAMGMNGLLTAVLLPVLLPIFG